MRKKSLILSIFVAALLIGTVIAATALYTFNVGMTANVAAAGDVTITVGGSDYTNGAPISLNWGTVAYGDNVKSITITNNANTPLTPSIEANPTLPEGWTLTLSLNSPIPTGQNATGTLTLNVPTGAAAGSYSSMSAKIDVSY